MSDNDWEGDRILNQYTIKHTLGEGAYGVVRYAIKTDDPRQEFVRPFALTLFKDCVGD